jgi:hypothetical protein
MDSSYVELIMNKIDFPPKFKNVVNNLKWVFANHLNVT